MQLITSLPPRMIRYDAGGRDVGAHYQRQCVESWVGSGFKVVSINRPGESVDAPESVEIVVSDEAGHYGDRYGPPFSAAFARAGEGPLAITNADIYASLLDGGAGALEELTDGAFVFAQRIDVANLDEPVGLLNQFGVDLIAFDAARLQPVVNDPAVRLFQYGCPWWDYVLPVAASFFGPVKRLTPPLLFHHAHTTHWDKGHQNSMRAVARAVLLQLAAKAGTPLARDFLAKAERLANAKHGFANLCRDWLFRSDFVEDVAPPVTLADPVLHRWFAAASAHRSFSIVFTDGKPAAPTLKVPALPNPPPFGETCRAIRADLGLVLSLSCRTLERSLRPYMQRLRGALPCGD
jgi:hypothetical protein